MPLIFFCFVVILWFVEYPYGYDPWSALQFYPFYFYVFFVVTLFVVCGAVCNSIAYEYEYPSSVRFPVSCCAFVAFGVYVVWPLQFGLCYKFNVYFFTC